MKKKSAVWSLISTVAIVVIATVAYLQRPEPPAPTPAPTVFGEATDRPATRPGGRSSENFLIVDDTLDGDVADEGSVRTVTDDFIDTNAFVSAVVDGDTIDAVLVDSGERVRVRMLGVNTPETVDPRRPVECFGKEASDFTKSLLTDARVLLEADPQADERDVYGRLLRNVITETGIDVSATLIAEGYAYAYTSFPMDPVRKKQLIDLESQAKEAKRGLWGDACQDHS